MTRRSILAVSSAVAIAAAVIAAVVTIGSPARHAGTARPATSPAASTSDAGPLIAMDRLCENQTGDAMRFTCYTRRLTAIVDATGSSADELPRIDVFARKTGGYLDYNCHIIMHWVGRAYARDRHLTLGQLQDALPKSNDPGCSAGFSHGMLTYLAPQIATAGPRASLAICNRAETRYQRYSCVHGLGHAYMRLGDENLPYALGSCRKLGLAAAPDCAQGAFHDYFIALGGADGTQSPQHAILSPRRLCAHQAALFVRPCWYRAYIELNAPFEIRPGTSLLRLCRGLDGAQRSGCITAGSVASSPDPFEQLAGCAAIHGEDAVSCIHGANTQVLANRSLSVQVRLLRSCRRIDAPARLACYEWLGKVLSVVTDGRFASAGCRSLAGAAPKAACRRGAADMDGALVTFS